MAYRGRFAPTPSGPLHFGSLVAALASYLDARAQGGVWLLRIEDVDPPRVVPGASGKILDSLAAHGFEWDGAVMYQSERGEAYADVLWQLIRQGGVYGCTCSRKTIVEGARPGVDGPVYPGACRGRPIQPGMALRFTVPSRRIVFLDVLLGQVGCDVAQECGDFVLRRADGVYAYQLAVVADDLAQGVTHVVRGADLLASTPRQVVLYEALGRAAPTFLHVPVALDAQGCKLSKQTLATPLVDADPMAALRHAGRFLGLPELSGFTRPKPWLAAAMEVWSPAHIPRVTGIQVV